MKKTMRTLEKAAVMIEAHKQSLLTQPDPAIAKTPLLRVPLGEGNDIGYSAADWTNCWRMGSIEFCDAYYLAHNGRQLPKEDMNRLSDYLYINRLDPASVQNWEIAFKRLTAAKLFGSQ